MRMLRTSLETLMDQEPALIMLTSPNILKHKSLISAKLAISLCERGKKVLLVDANLRNPSLHQWFMMDNSAGLTDAILEEGSLEPYAMTSFMQGLTVLSTGPITKHGLEATMINQLDEALELWKKQFDVIILEAPDLLHVADAHIMARHCAGVIIVAQLRKTKKAELLRAKKQLERADIPILGVVLQKRPYGV